MILPNQIQKIAVFRALQLGDLLCAIPAIRALRHAYPQAEIILLGLPWAASFIKRFNAYFNRFIHFPGYPGLPEQENDPLQWEAFTKQMQAENFDLVLQMQGNGTIVNAMLTQLGVRQIAGFQNKESYVNDSLFLEYPNYGHEANRHLLFMQHIGIAPQGNHLEFPITVQDKQALAALQLPIQKKKYVCVHPGSRGAWRQWPPAYFARLADACAEKGYQIIVTGTTEEAAITRKLIQHLRYPAIDLTGKTSLGAIACLIRDAFLLIANCTGVSHIASAVETPSLIISMDKEPERWGPIDNMIHTTIDWTKNPGFKQVQNELELLLQKKAANPKGQLL